MEFLAWCIVMGFIIFVVHKIRKNPKWFTRASKKLERIFKILSEDKDGGDKNSNA